MVNISAWHILNLNLNSEVFGNNFKQNNKINAPSAFENRKTEEMTFEFSTKNPTEIDHTHAVYLVATLLIMIAN